MSEQEKIADAIRASHAAGFAQGYAAGIKAQKAAAEAVKATRFGEKWL